MIWCVACGFYFLAGLMRCPRCDCPTPADADNPEKKIHTLLKTLSSAIVAALRPPRAITLTPWFDYHGFRKARIDHEGAGGGPAIAFPVPSSVQVEFVVVVEDLSHEIHYHREAHALTTVLGNAEGFPDPRRAAIYLAGAWRPVGAGDVFDIPSGTPHGFTVAPDGYLAFLSVQSPPIERPDGADDYYRTEAGA